MLNTPQGPGTDSNFSELLATEEASSFEMEDMLDLEIDHSVPPFDGLQLDVDLQTGVWMERIGITEDNFGD